MADLKRTPLFPLYAEHPGVRCIDFGGWELPVQFSGIQREHDAVRQRAGLFDVSHMGEFMVTGLYAERFLQLLTTNDVAKLPDGGAQYTLMCQPDGGVIDDLLIYRITADQFMVVVNASNIDKDYDWMQSHLIGDVRLENRSDGLALLALQGPCAADILAAAGASAEVLALPSFRFTASTPLAGVDVMISRTGYTGEDGFEIYAPAEQSGDIWTALLAAGEPLGLIPAGLGARDTLRFEARLPLYGHELSNTVTPLEAGVSFFVKLEKEDFIGRDALIKQKEQGLRRKLVGIEMLDRGIPRSTYPVYASGKRIGIVTTGTQSPTLKRNLGIALIEADYSAIGTELSVEIRGKPLRAVIVKTPFYKRLPKE